MPAQWLSHSSALSGRVSAALTGVLNTLAQPANARRLRQVLLCLLALWAVLALTRLIWALVPATEPPVAAPPKVLNPVSTGRAGAKAAPVDIDRMVAWHLFGEAGVAAPAAVVEPEAKSTANARAGIEEGARETRLQLKLRGIVASTEDGLGYAVIEYQNQQAVYAVEDKLPVAGQVVLAKVMPRQVVLDNGGTYELLVLYEESTLGIAPVSAPPQATAPQENRQIDKRADVQATSLAQNYRERLYQNPQSLADVVNISAVREGPQLRGYRLSPGKDQEQFTQLGFQTGDLVTSINGISLDDPTNTMVLYNTMREAGELVFELERQGTPLTLRVNLDGGATE
ncbi:MAG TPA: type II secretion system protein GspC [Halioglobus sp.]